MDPEDQGNESDIDWTVCTWEGARRAHLGAFRRLSFREKLEALEEWCDVARLMIANLKERGRPIIPLHSNDPATELARTAHR
ncbi:MAG: hypothetical protein ACC742_04770 [Thermoanaerobaculales bacterium]